jgi:hypothetical protein
MKSENNRSQDIPRKKEKPATRLVKMHLPLDLVDAIEVMAEDGRRTFHNMILSSLHWAAWAHSHGRGPDIEMFEDMLPDGSEPGLRGYAKWDERIRAKREIRALNQLFMKVGKPTSEDRVANAEQ